MQYFSTSQVANLEGVTTRSIIKRIKNNKYSPLYIKKEKGKGGRSGERTLIAFEALSPKGKENYLKSNTPESKPQEDFSFLSNLNKTQLNKYNRRLALVEEIAALPDAGKGRHGPMHEVALKHGYSYPSACRIYALYKERGFEGLVIQKRKKVRAVFIEPLQEMAVSLYFYERQPSMTQAHQALCVYARENGIPEPKYHTMRQFLVDYEENNPADAHARRFGIRSARQKFGVYIPRDFSYLYPNDLWMGDHTPLDILVINPNTNKPDRPWLTAWLDVDTRVIIGYHLSFCPSSRTIALALRNGIVRDDYRGIPKMVYIDNGKDYRAKLFGGRSKEFGKIDFDEATKSVFYNLRVGVTYALPYNPQSKAQIERWFGTLERGWMNLYPGYTGSSVANRPEKLEREVKSNKLLSFIQLKEIVADAIHAYHHKKHSQLGQAPLERFMDRWQREDRVSTDAFELLLLPQEEKTIRRDGITFRKNRYFTPEFISENVIGKRAIMRFDPDDPTQVNVTCNGIHFGWIDEVTAVQWGDKESMKAGMQLKRRQEKIWKKAVNSQLENHQEMDRLLRGGANYIETEIEAKTPDKTAARLTGLEGKAEVEKQVKERKNRDKKSDKPFRIKAGVV